jgi:hypothetical protein
MGLFDFFSSSPKTSEVSIYEPDTSVASRAELLKRGTEATPNFPLQQTAGMTSLEEYIQGLLGNYVKSPASATRQNAIDLATKTANEPYDVTQFPEVQGLMKRITEAGQTEGNRLMRGMQLRGSSSSSRGRDILGRNVTDMQQKIASGLSPYLESERQRQFGAIGLMSDLENAQTADLLQKLSTGSQFGALPRQILQDIYDKQYAQQNAPINFRYSTQPGILQSMLQPYQVLQGGSGQSESGFSQIAPLIGPALSILGPILSGGLMGSGATTAADVDMSNMFSPSSFYNTGRLAYPG